MSDLHAATTQRAEYLARVHRVMDYIEHHLGEPPSLETLAGVANFSPYHFHRVFSSSTGETRYQFILRLRLERAASKAARQPHLSLTAIALDCGFGSSVAFSRAFRAAFGTSATEWRREVRKNRETLGEDREAGPDGAAYIASHGPAATAGADKGGQAMAYDALPRKEASSVRASTARRGTGGWACGCPRAATSRTTGTASS